MNKYEMTTMLFDILEEHWTFGMFVVALLTFLEKKDKQ